MDVLLLVAIAVAYALADERWRFTTPGVLVLGLAVRVGSYAPLLVRVLVHRVRAKARP